MQVNRFAAPRTVYKPRWYNRQRGVLAWGRSNLRRASFRQPVAEDDLQGAVRRQGQIPQHVGLRRKSRGHPLEGQELPRLERGEREQEPL